MKKIIIFLIEIGIIVAIVSYMYVNYRIMTNQVKQANAQYESMYEKEIYGTDLATLINKVVDDNTKNKIEKDDTGLYKDNGKNSIRVDIHFLDDDSVHTLEEIYASKTSTFVQYYNQVKFKCTKIEYHEQTGRVRYLYFEQIAT